MNRRFFLKSLTGAITAAIVGDRVIKALAPAPTLPIPGEIGRYENIRFITGIDLSSGADSSAYAVAHKSGELYYYSKIETYDDAFRSLPNFVPVDRYYLS